ncbi:MAG: hypothetical protein ACYDBK_02260 [Thermoplasmataceae archaeon]
MPKNEEEGGISSLCIYNYSGDCLFSASYLTKCRLCFNFCTPVAPAGNRNQRGLYTIADLAFSPSDLDKLFPSSNQTQRTL